VALALLLGLAFLPGAARSEGLNGTWGLQLEVASVTRVPVLRDVESTMVAWALSEVGVDGRGTAQTYRVCEADVRDNARASRTLIPPAYVAHMPYRVLRPVTDGSGSFELDLGPVPVGYHHDRSPAVLPQDAADPLVYDWDEDGHPGATVRLELPLFQPFEVYIVQVSHLVLQGHQRAPDRIDGAVLIRRQERVTLGASNRIFARQANTEPDPSRSVFSMRRLPAGTTCAQVRRLMESP
jgi:hypothetical protein